MSIGARIDITFKDQWLGPIDVFWGWLSFLAELKAVHENGRGAEVRTKDTAPRSMDQVWNSKMRR